MFIQVYIIPLISISHAFTSQRQQTIYYEEHI